MPLKKYKRAERRNLGRVYIRTFKRLGLRDFVRLGGITQSGLYECFKADGTFTGFASPRDLKPLYPAPQKLRRLPNDGWNEPKV